MPLCGLTKIRLSHTTPGTPALSHLPMPVWEGWLWTLFLKANQSLLGLDIHGHRLLFAFSHRLNFSHEQISNQMATGNSAILTKRLHFSSIHMKCHKYENQTLEGRGETEMTHSGWHSYWMPHLIVCTCLVCHKFALVNNLQRDRLRK